MTHAILVIQSATMLELCGLVHGEIEYVTKFYV